MTYLLFLTICMLICFARSLDNGLARTPPMGWLSWERFGCNTDCNLDPDTCISERLYLEQATLLIEDGYRDVGYKYVNIDDCWSERERNQDGTIAADRKRFPSGLRYLSDTLHSMGLLFGLYSDIGYKTCAGYPGLEGYFEIDAHTFAHDFQIDSLKVDGCYREHLANNLSESYMAFGEALNRTGRPILYACSWPCYIGKEGKFGEEPDLLNTLIKQHCNIWRNYYDISDDWVSVQDIINQYTRTGPNDTMVRAAGPGHFNDPDMLIVGNPGLSISEQQSQFALWSIFAAPLLISADLRTIRAESAAILKNVEIIAVNQDPLGRQGWCANRDDEYNSRHRIWVRELKPSTGCACKIGTSDTWAVVLQDLDTIFNTRIITFDPKKHLPYGDSRGSFLVRDLINHQDMGLHETLEAKVDVSSVMMFKIVFLDKIHGMESDLKETI